MSVWDSLERIRTQGPVVHCITNTVAANFAANAVIAVGGSPVMASEPAEVAQVTQIASGLTVNIGTCGPVQLEAIKNSAIKAQERGLPWVLDPVGVAATETRRRICRELISEYGPAVIRANASEVVALASATDALSGEIAARGLDSTLTTEKALPAARALAAKFGMVVAISGSADLIVDGRKGHEGRVARIANGDAMMANVTATGCSLTAVVGAFLAVVDDVFDATVHAHSYYAVAGQIAAKHARGTGSMHMNILDALSSMTIDEYQAIARPVIDLSLYLVTDPELTLGREVPAIVKDAIDGGVTAVQLREKDADSGEFLERARAVKAICDKANIPLIINDRVDIALAVDAAGVHVGQDDLPVDVVRRLIGPNKVLGLSVRTREEAAAAADSHHMDVDYVGVGPVFATKTKKNAKAPLDIEGLVESVGALIHPAVAIGGINAASAADILKVPGINGVAVVTALTLADDPAAAARELLRK